MAIKIVSFPKRNWWFSIVFCSFPRGFGQTPGPTPPWTHLLRPPEAALSWTSTHCRGAQGSREDTSPKFWSNRFWSMDDFETRKWWVDWWWLIGWWWCLMNLDQMLMVDVEYWKFTMWPCGLLHALPEETCILVSVRHPLAWQPHMCNYTCSDPDPIPAGEMLNFRCEPKWHLSILKQSGTWNHYGIIGDM